MAYDENKEDGTQYGSPAVGASELKALVVRQDPPEAVDGEWEDCWSCGGKGGWIVPYNGHN